MNYSTINHRGSQIIKVYFDEIEQYFEECGFNTFDLYDLMADDNEIIYISFGFLQAIKRNDFEEREWHHYFKVENNDFVAYKLNFN